MIELLFLSKEDAEATTLELGDLVYTRARELGIGTPLVYYRDPRDM